MAEVRTIDAVDIDAWVQCMGTGFLKHIDEGYGAYELEHIDLARTWAAFDGTAVVGTLRSFDTPFTIPGPAELTASALTNVTVAPTHRRQGLLRSMISADLLDAANRGDPLGILIAAEWGIYGRFGYGPATWGARYAIDADAARFEVHPGGSVALVDGRVLRQEAPSIYERFRVSQPGAIGRNDAWWDRALRQVEVPGREPYKGYEVLYRSAEGEATGYVRYQAEQKWDEMRPRSVITIDELVAVTDDAYNRLWQYCCEVDLVSTVLANDRPVDEPLFWSLADARVMRQTSRHDFVWVRVLDVCKALSGRMYGADARVVIEVVDPMGFATGRFALDGGPAGATCASTTEAAQLTMPVDVLGSLYMGGVSLRRLSVGGRVTVHDLGSLATADAMFRSRTTPWCSTWF